MYIFLNRRALTVGYEEKYTWYFSLQKLRATFPTHLKNIETLWRGWKLFAKKVLNEVCSVAVTLFFVEVGVFILKFDLANCFTMQALDGRKKHLSGAR